MRWAATGASGREGVCLPGAWYHSGRDQVVLLNISGVSWDRPRSEASTTHSSTNQYASKRGADSQANDLIQSQRPLPLTYAPLVGGGSRCVKSEPHRLVSATEDVSRCRLLQTRSLLCSSNSPRISAPCCRYGAATALHAGALGLRCRASTAAAQCHRDLRWWRGAIEETFASEGQQNTSRTCSRNSSRRGRSSPRW